MAGAKRIISVGLLAGTLDISAACIQYCLRTGKGPESVLRFVASGLFGKQAFEGDKAQWIAAGLLIHYLVAMSFTLFFVLLIRNIAAMRLNRFVTGILYGVFVWAVMNKVVLPLIKTPSPKTLSSNLQAMGILIICIGMPLSFLLIQKKRVSSY